jgi:hypothetical protein
VRSDVRQTPQLADPAAESDELDGPSAGAGAEVQ